MFKVTSFLAIIFIFFVQSSYSLEENYKELEKIEEKLKYNKKVLLDLKKIEKELNFDIKKIEKNLKRYKYLIQKGYNEKNKVKDIIKKKKEKLRATREKIKIFKRTQLILIKDSILRPEKIKEEFMLTSLKKNIYKNITKSNEFNAELANELTISIEENKSTLEDLGNYLNKIRKKVNFESTNKESILGATLITAIQKEKNKFMDTKIRDRAGELKKLIEKLEKNKIRKNEVNNINFGKLKDMIPVGKLSIEKIKTDKLKKGILLFLKEDSILKAPNEALVVYADNFKGFGNMVILDLGNNFHLIFSGLSNILCKTGDWVQKGVILGDINKNLSANTLYMEVRFKGKTINPSKWLRS